MAVPHYGDYDTTETVYIPFNTFDSNDPSASVTITNLAATDLHVHKDGSVTQRSSTSGFTITINFDSITGNHMAAIDLSDNTDAGFYANGSQYSVRMEGTTVDGATINAWIGSWSIGRTLRPTTAGRKLDVTATGAAGIDWGNVENPTTAVDLSGTDIQLCDTVTTNTDMRGTDSASLASVCTEARLAELDAANLPTDVANVKTDTAAILTDTGTTLDTKLNDIQGATFSSVTDSLEAIRDHIGDGTNLTEAGGTGDHLTAINLPNQTMDITGNITGNLSGSVGSVTGAVGSVTGNVGGSVGSISGVTFPTNFADLAITVTTGRVTVGTNADKTGYSISGSKTTLDALNDLAFADIWTGALTEAYAADGSAFTPAQGLFMIWAALSEFAVSGTTITAKKLDGLTTAMTFTLDDATDPTSRTRAT